MNSNPVSMNIAPFFQPANVEGMVGKRALAHLTIRLSIAIGELRIASTAFSRATQYA